MADKRGVVSYAKGSYTRDFTVIFGKIVVQKSVVFCFSPRVSPMQLSPALSSDEKVENFHRSVSFDSVHLVSFQKCK